MAQAPRWGTLDDCEDLRVVFGRIPSCKSRRLRLPQHGGAGTLADLSVPIRLTFQFADDPLRGRRRVDRKLGILQQSNVCCQVLRSGPNTQSLTPTCPRGPSQRLRATESLFFKTPYVWEVRWPRPGAKLRSPCRAVDYVHDCRLDAASDGGVTAILPV